VRLVFVLEREEVALIFAVVGPVQLVPPDILQLLSIIVVYVLLLLIDSQS
jgi:hypothetical protein